MNALDLGAVAKPYTLAFSCSKPDLEFSNLQALARAIVEIRDTSPRSPEISAISARLTRSDLPGGAVVAVRMLDGSCGGRGELIGYAFMPANSYGEDMLMRAIVTEAITRDKAKAVPA